MPAAVAECGITGETKMRLNPETLFQTFGIRANPASFATALIRSLPTPLLRHPSATYSSLMIKFGFAR